MQKFEYSKRFELTNHDATPSEIVGRLFEVRGAKDLWRQADEQPEKLYDLKNLLDPHGTHGLKGLSAALARLTKALDKSERILIVGDYDADGATATALLISFFRQLGHEPIDYLVPNRFEYGYGLSVALVKEAAKQNPDVIITVDNGIANVDGADLCWQSGIDLIITDHHLPGETLPEATAIINPNQPDCLFPSKALAGVGVAFYLACALKTALIERGYFKQQGVAVPRMDQYLDLVALGTTADLVPLDDNNRTIVYQGLRRIRAGAARPGIKALFHVAGKDPQKATAQDFGFILGPRLNAAGRLDDISIGIECLLAVSDTQATELAQVLQDLNADRRKIEAGMTKEAELQLQALTIKQADASRFSLALYHPDWHEGVIGILASRVKERHYLPCIVFARSESDNKLKGSARSIPGLHIRDVLANIDSAKPGLLLSFGGHAMAAGLSIVENRFDEFSKLFEQYCASALENQPPSHVHQVDTELPAASHTLTLAECLEQAGPWGQKFPEPSFFGVFFVKQARLLGKNTLKLTLLARADHRAADFPVAQNSVDQEIVVEALKFRAEQIDPRTLLGCYLDCVYQLQINRFRGNQTLQLLLLAFNPSSLAS